MTDPRGTATSDARIAASFGRLHASDSTALTTAGAALKSAQAAKALVVAWNAARSDGHRELAERLDRICEDADAVSRDAWAVAQDYFGALEYKGAFDAIPGMDELVDWLDRHPVSG